MLEYRPGPPIAVVEVKWTSFSGRRRRRAAKRYARKLEVSFAYATNGLKIREIDLNPGLITEIDAYPSPDELWACYRQAKGLDVQLATDLVLTPFDQTPKRFAVHKGVEAIGRGKDRVLLVLARSWADS
ncbi:hypothetical protein [Nonomuraea jabiensis]|uniref:Type I site-specific restriction endonuclease n=1 Tax=Nonomuraea jabiensis TaxID=882448 RepID=A0A7W9G7H6_9ACTN|nr:hypothetical protein [Nonomuraea jabiensis]MBB5778536.1 type I site-specific restriction endonuclease [Nonomuraea jabiensis]